MTTPTQTTPTPTTPIGSNWPSLPIPGDTTEPETSQGSPIQPAQKSPTAWKGQQRGPEEHEADRVGRFAKYFKGNEILPIPEIADKIAPRVLSLVVSDLKTKRLVGLTKEVFEDLIRKAGIPCQYFCRKSFATWDVLLPTEKQAAKVAESDVITKNFRLQPEYKGTRRLRVTVCNVPAIITGEVLAAYPKRLRTRRGIQPPQIPGRDSLRGLCLPAVPDQGWLQSHPWNADLRESADDGDGGGKTPQVLGV